MLSLQVCPDCWQRCASPQFADSQATGATQVNLRLTKLNEFQFLTCVKHRVWGSKIARFGKWKEGDSLAFIVDKSIAGIAKVSGKPFKSNESVWDNGLFPHRIPIKFTHLILPENRPPVLGQIRDALMSSAAGASYGMYILNQTLLPDGPADTILQVINSKQNDLNAIGRNLDHYLGIAKNDQEQPEKTIAQPADTASNGSVPPLEAEDKSSDTEDSIHSKYQNLLVMLGKITGCSVWIASNDQKKTFEGKPISQECLSSFPNLGGLNEEAIKRIKLIDVIWIRGNAPVAAFEVEITTAVYSGLLRMSDLLAEVPSLKIDLYIVAPRNKQSKVFGELSRPTFRKIGLNEYASFIPGEELEDLLSKVKDLAGHVAPSILNKIAVALADDVEGGLT